LYVTPVHAPLGLLLVQTCIDPPPVQPEPCWHCSPVLVPASLELPLLPGSAERLLHAWPRSAAALEQSVHPLHGKVRPSAVLYVIEEHCPARSWDVQSSTLPPDAHAGPGPQLSVVGVTIGETLHAPSTARTPKMAEILAFMSPPTYAVAGRMLPS
jgi:hypothetical protein